MGRKDATIDAMLRKMATGWEVTSTLPLDFMELWSKMLGRSELRQATKDSVYFASCLDRIRLKGADDAHVMCVSGDGATASTRSSEFVRAVQAPGRMLFVITFSPAACESVTSVGWKCLVCGLSEMESILQSENPTDRLRGIILKSVAKPALISFNILLPAKGNMFYGRTQELLRLKNNEDSCFAIAGPSRIGKTSLALRYREELIKDRDPAGIASYYLDCYECAKRTAIGFLQFIAMRLDGGSSRSRIEGPDDFSQFLRYLRSKNGRIPLVILDETDELCSLVEIRTMFATITKQAICRFILCGRGKLLEAISDSDSPMQHRFELIRLRPLEEGQGERLLCEPLLDLGLRLEGQQDIVTKVLQLTGSIPHLIQYYGKRLAEYVINERADNVVRMEHVEQLKWDFETARYFTSPLADIKNPKTQLAAYLLLRRKPTNVTYPGTYELLRAEGVEIDHIEARRICDELVIQNVLVWTSESVSYRIANEAMPEYAEKLGLLEKGIKDLKYLLSSRK